MNVELKKSDMLYAVVKILEEYPTNPPYVIYEQEVYIFVKESLGRSVYEWAGFSVVIGG